MSLLHHDARREVLAELSRFRGEFYSCLTVLSDALFELVDAVLRGDGPVRSLAELSLVGEHRRGHGGLYAALAQGRVDADRMRWALASVPLPRSADGRLVLAVDVTAGCGRTPTPHHNGSCVTPTDGQEPTHPHPRLAVLDRWRAGTRPQLVDRTPGRVASRAWGRHRHRHRPAVARADRTADHHRSVADRGPGRPRHCGRRIRRAPLAFLLKDLPAEVLARMRSDRVLRRPAPPRQPHIMGRPPRHGGEFVFGQPDTWGTPDTHTVTDTRLYGTTLARPGTGSIPSSPTARPGPRPTGPSPSSRGP